MDKKPFYITTPIYYVNGAPHLGHAYTTIACDVMARFKKLDGHPVRFLTGTDEHGIKVYQTARDQGVSAQELVDRYAQQFKDILPLLNIDNDDFIRTTEERHKKGAQALWKKLDEAGQIYKDSYSGWYAVRDEAYYNEDELTTNDKGEKVAPSGAPVTWMEEESYFFKLSEWGEKLLKFYDENPGFIQPESSRKEVVSFVKSGLKDLSISRTTFDWGVPVPGDPKHVMYVWIDALANYITALDYPEDREGLLATFWPGAVHVVGKEITRFHCVYWPAFLMAAGVPCPQKVVANGWWVVEGQKMSKSLGNVLEPADLIAKYGLDPLRFALMSMVSFGSDGNFSHARAVETINAFCANALGNLAQRTLSFIQKNAGGVVPEKGAVITSDITDALRVAMDNFNFSEALNLIRFEIDKSNRFIDEHAPWTLRKQEKLAEMNAVLYQLCEDMRRIAIILQPFMPESMNKLLDMLAVPQHKRAFAHLTEEYALKPGTKLPEPQALFPRLEA